MSRRGDIANGVLLALCGAAVLAIVGWLALRPDLPAAWQAPGTPLLQSIAIAGALLLLVPLAFAIAKRGGHARTPALWFSLHAIAALLGTVLVTLHTAGRFGEPPAMQLLLLLALMALGVWARVRGARRMADTFATKRAGFDAPSANTRERLAAIIADKQRVLADLDLEADEATFSVTLAHWLAKPKLARRYAALARAEAKVMGQRTSVGRAQAWWRPLHMALSTLFLAGLALHVILVTFFAGWVADGGEVYWWHITQW